MTAILHIAVDHRAVLARLKSPFAGVPRDAALKSRLRLCYLAFATRRGTPA
jgi:hypothetical protein